MKSAAPKDGEQPTLLTLRLRLRPYRIEDSEELVILAGDRAIADTTISIPHPYPLAVARENIETWQSDARRRTGYHYALCRLDRNHLIGGIELRRIDPEHLQGELSFWVGRTHQGQGIAAEAAHALIDFGFGSLGLRRIYAYHMVRNRASERVLEKLGMRREGLLRDRVRKWGRFEDVGLRAILSTEWG